MDNDELEQKEEISAQEELIEEQPEQAGKAEGKVDSEPEQAGIDSEAEKARAEAEDYKRKWYSVTAEYENYRKRTSAARSQAYADGRGDVVIKLFPIADNLERALASCKEEQTKKGIEMVLKSFEKLLSDEKITPVDPVGEAFDPETSEAIMAVEDGALESGTVKEVYLKGYKREDKVLRFAQVVVVK